MNILKIITPTNIAEEKAKFFDSTSYNPIFEYEWETEDLDLGLNPLKSLLIQAIFDQDHERIVKSALSFFETDLEEYRDLSSSIIYRGSDFQAPNKTLEATIKAFEEAFRFFDLDYKVEIVDKHGFSFRPEAKNKKLVMSKYAESQFMDIDGSVKHEMVHILRFENRKFNEVKKSLNYLPTEEGLASYMQDKTQHGKASEFQHAAEYQASIVGVKGSLRDIFNYFISIGFTQDLAWQRSIRHKFGFKDTSLPGDIIKPAMYFYNSQKVRVLSKEDILKLFIGKIAIDDLENFEEYKGKFDKDKLIEFYNLS